MEIYATEEEWVAALKRWWKTKGIAAIVGVLIGIAIISGWNFWNNQQDASTNQASLRYQQLLSAVENNQNKLVDKIAQSIVKQHGSTVYADYVALFQAKVKVDVGELEAAKVILQTLLNKTKNDISHVARMRLVRLLLATGQYEQGLQLIAEVDIASSAAYAGNYQALTGDLYVALNRLGEARTSYQKAMYLGYRSRLLPFKVDDIASAEIIQPE